MLPETPVLLTGEGARQFAREHGAELCQADALITHEQRESYEEPRHGGLRGP